MSAKFGTTIGFERRHNNALRQMGREEFVRYMTTNLPPRPANMLHIVAVNQGREPYSLTEPTTSPLSPASVDALIGDGAVVIDTRSASAFGAGHIPGSLNVTGGSSQFEQYVGWTLPSGGRIVLVAENDTQIPGFLRRLAFVGLESRVLGSLAGGFAAWRASGRPTETLRQVSVAELRAAQGEAPVPVLDVRQPEEWQAGHLPGAVNQPYRDLAARLESLPFDRRAPVAVVCAGGVRSSLGASILLRHGYRDVYNVIEGTDGWRRQGYPVETPGIKSSVGGAQEE